MASTERLSIGTTLTTGVNLGLRTASTTENPIAGLNFYPSTAAEDDPVTGRIARSFEVFFLINTITAVYPFACRNFLGTGNQILSLSISSSAGPTFRFQLRDGSAQQNFKRIDVSFTGIGFELNVWYHAILTSSLTQWVGYIGRVGLDINGNPTTADTMPYPATNSISLTSGNRKLAGMRQNSTVVPCIGIGNLPNQATGDYGNSVRGAVAEFRLWADNLFVDTSPEGYYDLRDQFVTAVPSVEDPVGHPNLIHCFRCNEPVGTIAPFYIDVGFKGAAFNGAIQQGAFASSPMPVQVPGGRLDLTAAPDLTTTTQGTPSLPGVFGLTSTNQTTTTETSTVVQQIHGFDPADDLTQTSDSAVVGVIQGFDPADDLTQTSDSATIGQIVGFAPSADLTQTSEASVALSIVYAMDAADDLSQTSENNPVLNFVFAMSGTDTTTTTEPVLTLSGSTIHDMTATFNVVPTTTTEASLSLSGDFRMDPPDDLTKTFEDSGWTASVAAVAPSLYWRMDALPTVDDFGSGVTGSLSAGSVAVVAGMTPATSLYGSAIQATSAATSVLSSSPTVGNPNATTNEFSVACTIWQGGGIGAKGYARKRASTSVPFIWQIRTLAGTQIAADRQTAPGGTVALITPSGWNPDLGHFVVATFTPGSFRLYVDGVLQVSDGSALQTATSSDPIELFQSSIVSGNGGTVDDFLVFDRELSSTEVTVLYAAWVQIAVSLGVTYAMTIAADTTQSSENLPALTVSASNDLTPVVTTTQTSESTLALSIVYALTRTESATTTEPSVVLRKANGFAPAANLTQTSEFAAPAAVTGKVLFPLADLTQTSEATPRVPLSLTQSMSATNLTTSLLATPVVQYLAGFAPAADLTQTSDTIITSNDQLLNPVTTTTTTREGPTQTDTFAQVLALNFPPTFWWQLDSVTGANDSGTAGTGSGTVTGATLGANGILSLFQTSALFDADGDKVQSNDTLSWQTTVGNHSYSLGAWFTINSFSAGTDQFICSKQAFASLRVKDDGTIVFARTNGSALVREATSVPGIIGIGHQYFVVGVYQATVGMKLYVNGDLVAVDTQASTQNLPVLREFLAGRDTPVSGENFDGRIQHVFLIVQTALSLENILTLIGAAGSGGGGAAAISLINGFVSTDLTQTSEALVSVGQGSLPEAAILERERLPNELLTLEEYMSVLDIWNVALTRLGIEPVTSAPTSDGSPQGVILATNWPLFKEAFLRDASWDGAKKTAALATFKDSDGVTPVVPTARWNFAYERPSDHVRSLRLNGRENRPGDKDVAGSLGLWEEEVATNDVGTRKRCLFTDEASANLEYVFLVPDSDITLMPADMRWAMALALAAHVATSFGKTTTEASMLELDAEKAKRNALRTDAATGTKPTLIDYTIANAFW